MKEMVKVVDNSKPKKSPEEKQYLICIHGYDNDIWNIVTGRTAAYEFIKEYIEDINLEDSFILVENCNLNQRKSIYAFIKHVESFYEDNFDIDDYVKGDWSEQDYRSDNDISEDLNIDNNDKFNIADLIDGNVNTKSLE